MQQTCSPAFDDSRACCTSACEAAAPAPSLQRRRQADELGQPTYMSEISASETIAGNIGRKSIGVFVASTLLHYLRKRGGYFLSNGGLRVVQSGFERLDGTWIADGAERLCCDQAFGHVFVV